MGCPNVSDDGVGCPNVSDDEMGVWVVFVSEDEVSLSVGEVTTELS